MQLNHFMVPVLESGSFEEELNAFLRGHRVLDVKRELVSAAGGAYWAISVAWMEGKIPLGPESKAKRVDYREILDEKDFAVFARLRELRKEIAEGDGVPPYAIFTNEQLARMVTDRVTKEVELRKIEGVGEAKTEKFGARFLSLLRETQQDRGVIADETGGKSLDGNS